MRKQYHFRASPAGLQAWDVDRLVELAKHLPHQRVPLTAIREIDEAYWSNEGTTQLTCRDVVEHARLIQDCDFDYPVILSHDGRVMDALGHARHLGLSEVLLTCGKGNIASARIIRRNGGVLESEEYLESRAEIVQRYVIVNGSDVQA